MDTKTIIYIALGIIWTLFGASITAVAVKYLNALKKDKNLGLLATWASQAVAAYQKSGLPNEQKKEKAIAYVVESLRKNKKLSLFSSEQISAAIEVAVNLLNEVINPASNTKDAESLTLTGIATADANARPLPTTTTTTTVASVASAPEPAASEPVTVSEPINQ